MLQSRASAAMKAGFQKVGSGRLTGRLAEGGGRRW